MASFRIRAASFGSGTHWAKVTISSDRTARSRFSSLRALRSNFTAESMAPALISRSASN